MRLIAFILAVLVAGGPAAAQSWQEYSYPAYSFTVAFPAEPQIETTTYQVADGRLVEAHVYSVRLNNGVFKVTVAELANTNLEESTVIDHAIKTLSEGGEVKINIPHRIYRIYGRQLSVARADGSLTTAAVFFANDRLYQIESTKFAGGSAADAIRFQQSLTFDRNVANRTSQQMQAFRASCQGINANPAGLDDPRCARQ